MKVIRLAITAMFAVLVGHQAHAGLTSYTSEAAFDAAVTITDTIGFEAQASGTFNYVGGGLMVDGVSFTNPGDGYLFVVSGYSAYDWGTGANLLFGSNTEGSRFKITLPTAKTAFGFTYLTEDDSNPTTGDIGSYTFVVDGTTFDGTSLPKPNQAFFGVTSDVPISEIDINIISGTGGPRPLGVVDNVSLGSVAAVPEPASILLLGAALAGTGLARRRKAS
jgi:hypothetical protein